jgi:DNA invertase Pin-like site-specific DNA recombinase
LQAVYLATPFERTTFAEGIPRNTGKEKVSMSSEAWLIVAVVAVPLLAAGFVVQLGRRRAAAVARDVPAVPAGPVRAVGYTTFPDRRQTVSPEGRYQARRIANACEARGMVLHKLVGDVRSYSGPDLERPALVHALTMLEAGEASCLIVTTLDRLSRSAANLGTLIDWVEELGVRLVVIDIDLDTSTEQGRVAARALARVGALEREHEEQEPAEPDSSSQMRAGGRPAVADRPLLQRRIATMRASGMTLQAIADTLNREGVPTLRGGSEWRPSSVQAAVGYKRPRRHEP